MGPVNLPRTNRRSDYLVENHRSRVIVREHRRVTGLPFSMLFDKVPLEQDLDTRIFSPLLVSESPDFSEGSHLNLHQGRNYLQVLPLPNFRKEVRARSCHDSFAIQRPAG